MNGASSSVAASAASGGQQSADTSLRASSATSTGSSTSISSGSAASSASGSTRSASSNGGRSATSSVRALGCFRENGTWASDGLNCAADQATIFQKLSGLTSLERSAYQDSIPVQLLTVIDAATPPPQPQTAQGEADVANTMRSAYTGSENEQAARILATSKLQEGLLAAEQRLKALQTDSLAAAAAPTINAALLWITDMKKTAAENLLSIAEIQTAAREINTLLRAIQKQILENLPKPIASKDIHRRIDILMQMMDTDVPRALSTAGLALPLDTGVALLTLRTDIAAMHAQDCWTGTSVCPAVPDVLKRLQVLIDEIHTVTAGHDSVRSILTWRYLELQNQ